jgi:hypothetical protein
VRETAISDQSNQAVARQLDRYSRRPSGVDGTPILRFRRSVGFNLIRLSAVLPVRLNCQQQLLSAFGTDCRMLFAEIVKLVFTLWAIDFHADHIMV